MRSLIDMTNASKNRTLQFPFLEEDGYYEGYVFLIDILGFSNYVNEASFEDIRQIFKKFEDKVDDGSIHFTLKEQEYEKAVQGQKWTGSKSYKPAFTFFSDTIIMCIPDEALVRLQKNIDSLTKEQHADCENRSVLYQLIILATSIQLDLLKLGFLSRGAITYGKVFNRKSVWFGPAIVEAHELETLKGNYAPRIIFSENLILKLNAQKYEANMKQGILSLKIDAEDERLYCDYLSWIHTAGFSDDYHESLKLCSEMADANITRFSKNEKIKQKWMWLKDACNNKIELI